MGGLPPPHDIPPFLPPPASLSRYVRSPPLQALPTTLGISTITGAHGRSRPAAEGLLPFRRGVRAVPPPVQVYGWTYLYNWAENDAIAAVACRDLGRCCTTAARDSGDAHTQPRRIVDASFTNRHHHRTHHERSIGLQ